MLGETELRDRIETVLEDVRLLDHPFYKRWTAGDLSGAELKEYAEQYRHFEVELPKTLSSITKGMQSGEARDFIDANLADEVGPPAHVELFDSFLEATGGSATAPAMPATQALVDAYRQVGAADPGHAIGGVVAYEIQAPGIAATKGASLRDFYAYDKTATQFWDVHAELDVEHGDWTITALASGPSADVDDAMQGMRTIAEAWWAFLDERDSRRFALADAGSN